MEDSIHYIHNKKCRLQIGYIEKQNRNVLDTKLEFILDSKVNNCEPKKMMAELSLDQEQLKRLLRKFSIPQLLYVHPSHSRITLFQELSIVLKDKTATFTKKQIQTADVGTNFQLKYWKGSSEQYKIIACFDPLLREVDIEIVGENCFIAEFSTKLPKDAVKRQEFIDRFKKIPQIRRKLDLQLKLKELDKRKKEQKNTINYRNRKFDEIEKIEQQISSQESILQKTQLEIYDQLHKIIENKSFTISRDAFLLETKSEIFPILPLTVQSNKNEFSHENMTSRIEIFRHIFLTQVIAHLIINQFGRPKVKQWKYRDGRTNYEYQDQNLQELRSCGHRFSAFREHSVPVKRKAQSAQIQSDESDSESEKENVGRGKDYLQRKKAKSEAERVGKKIKKTIKNREGMCTFTLISGKEKSQINKKRYCLYQMTRETDHTQALINFVQLVFSSYQKKELKNCSTDESSIEKTMGYFLHQFRVKRSIQSCFREYSRQSFFHKILNIGLRVLQAPNELIYLRMPFSHIFWSIRTIYHRHKRAIFENKAQKNKGKVIKVYRGCELTSEEIETLQKNTGGFIEMEGFISTTTSEFMSELFIANVQIIISVPVKNLRGMFDNGFAYISQCSQHSREREVLVNAFNLFKIVSHKISVKDECDIHEIELEYGSIKEIEDKVPKSQNYLQSQFLMKFEQKQIKDAKNLLEMKEEKMTTEMVEKLKQRFLVEEEKLSKWKNTLKKQENEEFTAAYERLSKWEKELLSNYLHQDRILKDIDNYGQLLMAVEDYGGAVLHAQRMIKQVERDRAAQGWQWRKSPCLVEKQLAYRLLLSNCLQKLSRYDKIEHHLHQLQYIKELYQYTVNKHCQDYVKLLTKMKYMYDQMRDDSITDTLQKQLDQLRRKYSLGNEIDKQMDKMEHFLQVQQEASHLSADQIEKRIKQQRDKLQRIQLHTYGKYSSSYLHEQYTLVILLKNQQNKKGVKQRSEREVIREGKKYLRIRTECPEIQNRQVTLQVFDILFHPLKSWIYWNIEEEKQRRLLRFICEQVASFISPQMDNEDELCIVQSCLQLCFKLSLIESAKPILLRLLQSTIVCEIEQEENVLEEIFIYAYGLIFCGIDIDREKFVLWVKRTEQSIQVYEGTQQPTRFPHSIANMQNKECFSLTVHGVKMFDFTDVMNDWVEVEQFSDLFGSNHFQVRRYEKKVENIVKYIRIYGKKSTRSWEIPSDEQKQAMEEELRRIWEIRGQQIIPYSLYPQTPNICSNISKYMAKGQLSTILLFYQLVPKPLPNTNRQVRELGTISKMHLNKQQMINLSNCGQAIGGGKLKNRGKRSKATKQETEEKQQCFESFFLSGQGKKGKVIEGYVPISTTQLFKWEKMKLAAENRLSLLLMSEGFRNTDDFITNLHTKKQYSKLLLSLSAEGYGIPPLTTMFDYPIGVRHQLRTLTHLHLPTLTPAHEQLPLYTSSSLSSLIQEASKKAVEQKVKQKEYLIELMSIMVQNHCVPQQLLDCLFDEEKYCRELLQLLMNSEKWKGYFETVLRGKSPENFQLEGGGIGQMKKYLQFERCQYFKGDNADKKQAIRYSVLQTLLSDEELHITLLKRMEGVVKYKKYKYDGYEKRLLYPKRKGAFQEIVAILLKTKFWLHEQCDTPQWWALPHWAS